MNILHGMIRVWKALQGYPLRPPAAPVLSGEAGDTVNTLEWDAVPGASSYKLYWALTSPVTKGDNVLNSVTSPFEHTGRTNGVTYYYRATASSFRGESELSNEVELTPAAAQPKGLFTWGYNSSGQLGLGDISNRSSPVQVGSGTDWASSAGKLTGHSNNGSRGIHAIKTGGTLWSWGYNGEGELGLGDTSHRSSPVQVGSGTDWSVVAAGQVGSSGAVVGAIKTGGTLWTWGSYGGGASKATAAMFGRGPIGYENFSNPVQVGALNDWSKLVATFGSMLSIKTDGTLWGWGYNGSGELGLGDRTLRSSPAQIGSGTDWSYITGGIWNPCFFAIKSDHTLWAVGSDPLAYGVLGLGDIVSRSSWTQVGSLLDWAVVSSTGHSTLAIKTDGTLWGWGSNFNGELGLGNRNKYSSPMQVGSLLTWAKIICGGAVAYAIKNDGTLWAWGANLYGELGLGDITPRSSPVQVGSGTNWLNLAGACSNYVAGIRG